VLKTNGRGLSLDIIVTLLLLVMFIPTVSFAARDRLDVKAYGSAVNSGNSGKTRDAALEGALRDAVATAVKEYLARHGITADEQAMATGIYSRAANFVLNYKILSERWISNTPEPLTGDDGTTAPGEKEISPAKPRKPEPDTYHVLIDATLDMGAIKRAIVRVMGAEHSMDLRLVLLDISDYETFTALMSSLKRVTVIEGISYDTFSRDRFVVTAHTVMDPATLAVEIGRETGPDFVVAAYGIDTIIIKAFPAQGLPSGANKR